MKKFIYRITEEEGLHARPAGLLVKFAKTLSSKVILMRGDKSAEATKLMAVMGMSIKKGQEVTVIVEGEMEETEFELTRQFFEEHL